MTEDLVKNQAEALESLASANFDASWEVRAFSFYSSPQTCSWGWEVRKGKISVSYHKGSDLYTATAYGASDCGLDPGEALRCLSEQLERGGELLLAHAQEIRGADRDTNLNRFPRGLQCGLISVPDQIAIAPQP